MTFRIRTKLILIIAITLISFLLTFYFVLNYVYENNLNGMILENIKRAEDEFRDHIREDSTMLSSTLEVFLNDKQFQDVYLTGNRDKLYSYGQPLFNKLRDKYEITHFYFHHPNGRNFVRLHNREVYGDEINRITFKNARSSGQFASGIELGQTAFALRVVAPYYEDGKLIGYVELGEEIEHFLDRLKGKSKNEFAIIADKEHLDREAWSSARKVKGLPDNWDESEKHLWVSRPVETPVSKACFTENNIEEFERGGYFIKDFSGEKKGFACGGFLIYDAGGKEVGTILALIDISAPADLMKKTASIASIAFVILSLITFFMIALLMRYSISKPIEDISQTVKTIAEGALTTRSTIKSKDEMGQLASAINSMATSLEEAKKELDRRVLELFTLYSVSKVLNTTFETEELLLRLVSDISKNLDIHRVMIMMLDEKGRELYPASFTGFQKEELKEVRRTVGEGLFGNVVVTGTGRLVRDVDAEPNLSKEEIFSTDIRSIIAVPFGRRENIIGLLCAFKDRPGMFEMHDLELFEAVAEQVAVALENARLYQETKIQAITDGLTGLFNHRFLRTRLATELERAARYGHNLSFIIFDIDNFKHYNDTNGHPQGDKLLKTLSELLRKSIRESDIACRYGGEEFAVILPETTKDAAILLANRIRKTVANHPFPFRESQPLGIVSISVGISAFPIDAGESDAIIIKADNALYKAKSEGRNRTVSA